ncbi:hypothetical protein OSB04_011074 [Centaurea solstitialis]|uniref:DUF4704 domain-containing protein n=1 Tax=Centaurea solstitialis TaxID=347529 RepID=A0AA38WL67_9ASTR|nr:hypothetical protein OSB04_011074 [Centaurea solstitialis]
MDDEKEKRAETSGSKPVNNSNVNNGSNSNTHLSHDVDAMLERACLDRDKELDKLMNPYDDDDDLDGFGFPVTNGALEFEAALAAAQFIVPKDPKDSKDPKDTMDPTDPTDPKPKRICDAQDKNAEIVRLVDSAIMGQGESMGTLKDIVSGVENCGEGFDTDTVAFLVVDTLLTTMGGVDYFEEDEDNNPPSVMRNSRAAVISGELIPWLPWLTDSVGFMSPRTRLARGLRTLLRACTRNRAMCSSAGLTGVLLRTAEKIFLDDAGSSKQLRWNGAPLCSCLQYLAGHSLSVTDLNMWFQLVRRMIDTSWAPRLMISLEKALSGKEARGPQASFEFDGESSGLLGPGEGRWPFPNGYAFATWIFVESFADHPSNEAKSGKLSEADEGTVNMPRLFSFVSADNQGIEAYFRAQFLVVESGSAKGKKNSVHFNHAFKPKSWYFICLEQISKPGSHGEVKLYIDGTLHESHPFDLPRISKPLAFCCIGTNPPPSMASFHQHSRQRPLFAEMGPIYIFKESIGAEMIARLASRGADSLPSFGNAAGLMWLANNAHVQNIEEESARLDADIGGYLHLLYHPSLLSGRQCPDASPSGPSGFVHCFILMIAPKTCEVLGHVPVATRMRPAEALWALAYGGPMSLLPFVVSKVDHDTLEPEQGSLNLCLATVALAAPIFRIISVAIQHLGNSNELCRARGPEVLSKILTHLLKTLSSPDVAKHTVADEEIVAAVVGLCQSQKNNATLKMQLFSTLLLDLKIWSLCSYGIQKKLLSSLADMVFTESSVLRDAKAIQTLLDGCRRCYWTVHENDSIISFSLNGSSPRRLGK